MERLPIIPKSPTSEDFSTEDAVLMVGEVLQNMLIVSNRHLDAIAKNTMKTNEAFENLLLFMMALDDERDKNREENKTNKIENERENTRRKDDKKEPAKKKDKKDRPSLIKDLLSPITGLMNFLTGGIVAGAIAGFGLAKSIGVAGVIIAMVFDGIYGAVNNFDTSKLSGFIGGILAGREGGMLMNTLKFAGTGALLGAKFGPIGLIAGAILGAVFGAIMNAIGAKSISRFIEENLTAPILKFVDRILGTSFYLDSDYLSEKIVELETKGKAAGKKLAKITQDLIDKEKELAAIREGIRKGSVEEVYKQIKELKKQKIDLEKDTDFYNRRTKKLQEELKESKNRTSEKIQANYGSMVKGTKAVVKLHMDMLKIVYDVTVDLLKDTGEFLSITGHGLKELFREGTLETYYKELKASNSLVGNGILLFKDAILTMNGWIVAGYEGIKNHIKKTWSDFKKELESFKSDIKSIFNLGSKIFGKQGVIAKALEKVQKDITDAITNFLTGISDWIKKKIASIRLPKFEFPEFFSKKEEPKKQVQPNEGVGPAKQPTILEQLQDYQPPAKSKLLQRKPVLTPKTMNFKHDLDRLDQLRKESMSKPSQTVVQGGSQINNNNTTNNSTNIFKRVSPRRSDVLFSD